MRIGISKHVGSISNVVVDIHYSLVLFVFFVTVPAITEADVALSKPVTRRRLAIWSSVSGGVERTEFWSAE